MRIDTRYLSPCGNMLQHRSLQLILRIRSYIIPNFEQGHRHRQTCLSSLKGCLLQVSEAVALILGTSLPGETPLMSAGLDSLGAVELLKELNRLLGHSSFYPSNLGMSEIPLNLNGPYRSFTARLHVKSANARSQGT